MSLSSLTIKPYAKYEDEKLPEPAEPAEPEPIEEDPSETCPPAAAADAVSWAAASLVAALAGVGSFVLVRALLRV
jgi:hypothetical protein